MTEVGGRISEIGIFILCFGNVLLVMASTGIDPAGFSLCQQAFKAPGTQGWPAAIQIGSGDQDGCMSLIFQTTMDSPAKSRIHPR